MRHSLRGAALLLLALFILPVFAADEAKDVKKEDPKDVKKDDVKKDDVKKDDPKKDDPKKDDPKKDDPKKEVKKDSGMVKVGTYTGVVVNFEEGKRSLKIRIDLPKLDVNAAVALQQANQELQLASIPKPGQKPQDLITAIVNAQKKVAEKSSKLYVSSPQEFDWSLTDDAMVRVAEPTTEFDDKGKPKKLTPKERAELKGDPKLPGYKGELADVRSNWYVQITLVRPKGAKPLKIDPKTKDVDPQMLAESKPLISMVVVIAEKKQ